MRQNPFEPKFDVKSLISQYKDIKPTPKTKTSSKPKEESHRVSNISGFPGIRALHNYFFAMVVPHMSTDDPNAPFQLMRLINDKMDEEFPYTKNTTGIDEVKSPTVRVDKNGKVMFDENGKPIKRAYVPKHYRRYFVDTFESGLWGDIESLGISEEQARAAHEVYEEWKRKGYVVIKKRGED